MQWIVKLNRIVTCFCRFLGNLSCSCLNDGTLLLGNQSNNSCFCCITKFTYILFSGEVCSKVEGDHLENLNASDPSSLPVSDEIGPSVVEEDDYEDDDSDEEYSIQRPAFMVTGEPDFDSGPPQDGLEYLRRVRYRFYPRLSGSAIFVYLSCGFL